MNQTCANCASENVPSCGEPPPSIAPPSGCFRDASRGFTQTYFQNSKISRPPPRTTPLALTATEEAIKENGERHASPPLPHNNQTLHEIRREARPVSLLHSIYLCPRQKQGSTSEVVEEREEEENRPTHKKQKRRSEKPQITWRERENQRGLPQYQRTSALIPEPFLQPLHHQFNQS